jgi:hypothetical protein
MVKTHVYNIGHFDLNPNQNGAYFWDVPEYPGNALCTWTVTALPEVQKHEVPTVLEQRVEVTDFFLLRKGFDSGWGSGTDGSNRLQLNYTIRNIGINRVWGTIIASAIELK